MFNIQTIETEINKNSVLARALHNFLGLRPDHYSRWFNKQSEMFIEGTDYTPLAINGEQVHNRLDHAITIEMAKHIALMSRSNKGREYRQALIELEREMNKPMTMSEIVAANAQRLVDQERRQFELEQVQDYQDQRLIEVERKAEEVEAVIKRKGLPAGYTNHSRIETKYSMSPKAVDHVLSTADVEVIQYQQIIPDGTEVTRNAFNEDDVDSAMRTYVEFSDRISKLSMRHLPTGKMFRMSSEMEISITKGDLQQ